MTVDTGPSAPERAPAPLPSATQVGRYILLKLLGQGGMGVVYAAYDPDLDRKIALKLLRPDGQTDLETARSRLLREAQAMARISHPNVIPIFDVGLFGDQVFLAMELIEGGTLSAWQSERQRSWREVLEVFLAAGRGLAAAHAVGLVHRDFKPANALVSRTGRVYVMDFGLARQVGADPAEPPPPAEEPALVPTGEQRMLEATLTARGFVVGTPQYMSPEQLFGDAVDARSDQFSFCAALYRALYGQRPFEPEQMRGVLKKPGLTVIQPPPREARVPAWVTQAVMRGLALKPSERFASMEELLAALSQQQRLAKRRRWQVATGVVVAVAALAGGVAYQQSQVCAGAGELMAEVWSPEALRQVEASLLATQSPSARDTATRVAQVLEGYARQWTQQRTEACQATRVRGIQPEELLARRVGCLERRRKDMRAVVGLLTRADAKLVDKALDAAYALPGLQECAELESLAEQQRLPEEPSRRAEIERLEQRVAELKALVDTGRYPAARELATQLEAPVRATGHRPLVAELLMLHGWLQEQLGESPEASRHLVQATIDAEAGRADRLKVIILNRLLFVEEGQRHFEQASQWGRLAEATLQRLGGEPVLESDLLVNQAHLHTAQGQLPQARALLERAQALQQQALAEEHPKRARLSFQLGRLLLKLGEPEQAVALLEQALRQTQAAMGGLHPDMVRRHVALSWALRELGQYERALEHARSAVAIREALFGPEAVQVAEVLDEVGMVLLGLQRHEEALGVYQRALELKRRKLEPGDEQLQYSYDGVGQALLGLGRAGEALEPLRQALSFSSVSSEALAESGFALAQALWRVEQPAEALREAARAQERFTQGGKPRRAAEVEAWLAGRPRSPERAPTGR